MIYRVLPILVLGLTAALTAAAIEFLPETLHFPVVEYSAPGNIRIGLYKNGELDQAKCRQVAAKVATAVRANCPACKVVERCLRGLDPERRTILSREPLVTASARMPGGKLTMTFSTVDPRLALGVCRQSERQTAAQPVDQRLRCFPALAAR